MVFGSPEADCVEAEEMMKAKEESMKIKEGFTKEGFTKEGFFLLYSFFFLLSRRLISSFFFLPSSFFFLLL